jgi:hypothetical protein
MCESALKDSSGSIPVWIEVAVLNAVDIDAGVISPLMVFTTSQNAFALAKPVAVTKSIGWSGAYFAMASRYSASAGALPFGALTSERVWNPSAASPARVSVAVDASGAYP